MSTRPTPTPSNVSQAKVGAEAASAVGYLHYWHGRLTRPMEEERIQRAIDSEVQQATRELRERAERAEAENKWLQDLLAAFDWQRINLMSADEVEKELLEAGYTKEKLAAGLKEVRATIEAAIAKRNALTADERRDK